MTQKPPAIALIVADPNRGRLGHGRALTDRLAGRTVLEHTIARACRIRQVKHVVVVHPDGCDPLERLDSQRFDKPVAGFAHPDAAGDGWTARHRAARAWSLAAWRGGLGGATVWDELLPAAPLVAALEHHHADAAVLIGGDWCVFDPAYADALLGLHLDAPDAMKLTFTQAPPGLSPLVTRRGVLADLAQKRATLGGVLAYRPRRPALDPIGREVNHPIPADVRDTARRFIHDTPGSIELLRRVAEVLGDGFATADASQITEACRRLEQDRPDHVFDRLPPEVVIELTPRRLATGQVTPQHHVQFDRPDLDPALARDVFAQCGDLSITLGGLGDATLHEDWAALAAAASAAEPLALHVETDLLADRVALAALTDPLGPGDRRLDLVTVRLNADTAAVYQRAMGVDRFGEVIETLQWLFDRRGETSGQDSAAVGMPWIIPRLVKTHDTLADLESFFDRWVHLLGHAVIDRSPTGGSGGFALMPDLAPVPMLPPWKEPSPLQSKRRLHVLSDGTVTLCGQDWLGRAALGNARDTDLLTLWRRAADLQLPHATPDHAPVCRRCFDWWALHRRAVAAHCAA
jgi:hypothetical protein